MDTTKHATRVEELYRTFRRIFSLEVDEVQVKRCFVRIVSVYESRLFPDLTYLEHTLEALRIGQSESIWTLPLASAIWYQHSVSPYTAFESNAENALEELPLLGVSENDVEKVMDLIRSTARGELRGYDSPLLADANTYARYGVSWDRTNAIVVLKAKQHNYTAKYVQKVIGDELSTAFNGKLYYSGVLKERFDESTRQNLRNTLENLKYIGKNNPNRRKLK